MKTETDLAQTDAEEFLSDVNAIISSPDRWTDAVRFYPLSADTHGDEPIPEDPPEERFDEDKYLRENPDVAAGIQRGEIRSGFDHWIRDGKHEGRTFYTLKSIEPRREFSHDGMPAKNLDPLSYEGDRPRGILERGGLKPLETELQGDFRIGEAPPSPGTLRGRLGQWTILILRRMLWWYTRSITLTVTSLVRCLTEHSAILEGFEKTLEEHDASICSIAQRLEGVENRSKNVAATQKRLDNYTLFLERSLRDLQAAITDLQVSSRTAQAEMKSERAAQESLALQLADIAEKQAAGTARIDEKSQLLETCIRETGQRLEGGLCAEMGAREQLAGQVLKATEQLKHLQANWVAAQAYAEQTRAELTFQGGRVAMVLQEARKCLPEPWSKEQLTSIVEAAEHSTDALYLAFENIFRGSREEIKQRHSIYLPFLASAGAGSPTKPVLDLGAGRGEWLELLREHQLVGRGTDRNHAMVALCHSLGLDVATAEALSHLHSLPDKSLGAVTSFHMVEHIPFTTLLVLLEEAVRVLQPGGLLILETPNPSNLQVAAHNFYLDPTHQHPLPAAMLRFFIEAKGFCNTKLLELHPYPPALVPPVPPNDPLSERLTSLLYGPQDYGIIAVRP